MGRAWKGWSAVSWQSQDSNLHAGELVFWRIMNE